MPVSGVPRPASADAAGTDVATRIKSQPGVPVFDDGRSTYYDETNPLAGVKITDTNTRIAIVKEPLNGSTITLQVGPSVKKR